MLRSLILISLFFGCATNNRKAHENLRALTLKSKFKAAVKLIKSDEFYPKESSRLLKLLELGTVYQLSRKYYQSLKYFNQAKELSDKLFTQSISKKIVSSVSNNNFDNYYGEKYERSLIRFYQALNHYYLYQDGIYEAHENQKEQILSDKERRFHLNAARSTILEWDSLLENYKASSGGETLYKSDLMAKLFGAYIHEQMGTRSDKRIALSLYKNAKTILFRHYNLYNTFNKKSKKFYQHFKKLPSMNKEKVEENYVLKTEYSKELLEYINKRIRDLKNGNKDNLKIIIQEGLISTKKARKIHFPIPIIRLHSIKESGGDIISFTGDLLSISAGTVPTISFELPEVKQKSNRKHIKVIIKNKKGEKVNSSKAFMIDPLSDIAHRAINNKISNTKQLVGTRLVAKHVAAIATAYFIYKAAGRGLQGKLAAGLSYAVANKAIAASELADLRFWSTLPHSLRMSSLKLKNGTYDLYLQIKEGEQTKMIKSHSFSLKKGEVKSLNINIF